MLNLRDNSEFVSEDKIVNNNSIGVQSRIRKDYIELGILSLILLATALTSLYSYLLFHTIAELFSIIIAGGIFVIAWNSRKNIDNSFFLVVGISFIFIGFMDLLHTLAYTGMGIFTGYGSNLPTQLWIAARYLQAFSFLYAALVVNKKVNTNDLILIYTIITSLLIFLIFNRLFPNCYIEGSGLTPFKIISEYIIISILFLTVFIMYKVRKEFNKKIFIFIVGSIISTMIAELAFTFYVSTYDLSNLIGHLFKIVAFFLLYRAIIEIGLENPFNLLFRKLKRSEISLREEKRFTETALNSQRDSFFIFDPSTGKALIWNKAFREVSGYSDEEISSMPAPISYYNEEDLKKAAVAIEDVKKEGKTLVEMNLITKDGKSIPFEYIGTNINDEEGNLKYIVVVGRDITERKKAEQKLEEFVSTVSHELRTPITVLIMSIEYLKNQKQKLTPEVEEKLLEGLSRNITALNELVEDILTLSKIDEEKLKIEWKDFYPLEVIHEIIDLMEPRLKEKNINIEVEVHKGIQLFGDSSIIEEIFRILIDNAIKYSHENTKIEIKAIENYKYITDSKEFMGLLFQFKDYGRGIRKEEIPKLFERFFRSEDVRDISGTGLGLAIAKELTQFHDGKIFVESEYGKGSTFSVFFHSNKNKG
ncbi:MAG: PAS domain S-box protein [Promethearchaeota archaeon]|nr:MAG: PAS domain S-box protein [Candidatus Lokiarchaeota archaeon]